MRRWRLALGWLAAVVLVPLMGCVADGPPIMGTAVAGARGAVVSWQPPPGTVPGSVVAYDVQAYSGSVGLPVVRFNSTATTQTITGLTNGTTYTFLVRAIDPVGNDSAWSKPSNPVTPFGPQMAAGGVHTCAVVAGGAVDCWGANSAGQLGNGTTTVAPTPVPVVGLTAVTAIAAGDQSTCALMTDKTVQCWGANSRGQLGNGTTTFSTVPVPVSGLTAVTDIAVGDDFACAVVAAGGAYCWGYNVSGQLGNGSTTNSSTPVAVSGITDAVAVTAGERHTCAVRSSGSVSCWGNNGQNQLGAGIAASSSSTPVGVPDVTGAFAVSAGRWSTCALVSGGAAKCWGLGVNGELGLGYYVTFHPAAGDVVGIAGATQIDTGDDHVCVTMSDGAAKCWGHNQYGQLGNGTINYCDESEGQYECGPPSPVSVLGLTGLTSIAGGDYHTCALAADGAGYCWGAGHLGNGTPGGSSSPLPVSWP